MEDKRIELFEALLEALKTARNNMDEVVSLGRSRGRPNWAFEKLVTDCDKLIERADLAQYLYLKDKACVEKEQADD